MCAAESVWYSGGLEYRPVHLLWVCCHLLWRWSLLNEEHVLWGGLRGLSKAWSWQPTFSARCGTDSCLVPSRGSTGGLVGFVRFLSFSFGVLGFRCAKEHLIFSQCLRYSEMVANGDCFEGSWGVRKIREGSPESPGALTEKIKEHPRSWGHQRR